MSPKKTANRINDQCHTTVTQVGDIIFQLLWRVAKQVLDPDNPEGLLKHVDDAQREPYGLELRDRDLSLANRLQPLLNICVGAH